MKRRDQNEETNKIKIQKPSGPGWHFRLYVTDGTDKSVRAQKNLEKICATYLPGECKIDVIDLQKEPKMARVDQVVAIPTLIRLAPSPLLKVVGDLSDVGKVLMGMEIEYSGEPPAAGTGHEYIDYMSGIKEIALLMG